MAYQFAHIHAYSQSGSSRNPNPKTTAGCLGEAFREEGMASHVKNPKEPEILLGSREELSNSIKKYRENFKDSRGHKLRKDGKELLAGVFSWPPGTLKNQFTESLPTVLFFLMKKYSKSLRCVLSHEDEPFLDENGKYHGQTHFHIHFFIVPEAIENFRDYHPGIYAKWKVKKDGLNHWDADDRYKWSMGDWQNEVYHEVSLPLGWEKERPKEKIEKRLSSREQKIITTAKELSIQIQDEARKKAEMIVKDAKQKANVEAENIILRARKIEDALIIKKIELEEREKQLKKYELKIKKREKYNNIFFSNVEAAQKKTIKLIQDKLAETEVGRNILYWIWPKMKNKDDNFNMDLNNKKIKMK